MAPTAERDPDRWDLDRLIDWLVAHDYGAIEVPELTAGELQPFFAAAVKAAMVWEAVA